MIKGIKWKCSDSQYLDDFFLYNFCTISFSISLCLSFLLVDLISVTLITVQMAFCQQDCMRKIWFDQLGSLDISTDATHRLMGIFSVSRIIWLTKKKKNPQMPLHFLFLYVAVL